MWMGVPVISLAGTTHVSRVGASLLNTIGISELLAETSKAFVDIGMKLANDRSHLTELRKSLRTKMAASPLMDGVSFTRNFESALNQMWASRVAQP
jgi:predicted O-linked N-acetylglucosamine transferase (SPINDLY family)